MIMDATTVTIESDVTEEETTPTSTLRAIHELASLEADWDAEGAAAVSAAAIDAAQGVVLRAYNTAVARRAAWREPVVSPLPSGGVGVQWLKNDTWMILYVRGEKPSITLVREGAATEQETVTEVEAVAAVVELLEANTR